MEEIGRKKHSSTAMFLLFAEACTLLLLSAAVLACGFVLDMHDTYDTDYVDSQVDYTQYWVGFVFLITAFLTAAVAVRQRNRSLVITVLGLLLICIFVSLFALVVEGNDWVDHNRMKRTKSFWEDEDYQCSSSGTSCLCTKGNDGKTISSDVDCDDLNKLSNIYGGIVCCVLVGVFVALSSIVVIAILIPIRHFTLPEPQQRIRNITVLEDKPKTPPSPKIIYQKPPKPEVEEIVVREVSRRPPPQPQVVVREVQRPPPQPQVIVKEVERPPPRPQVIVKEVERLPPRPQVIVKEVERPPPRPQVIVKEVERPPPRPQIIVKEVERPPPRPQVIVKEVERPPPRPQVIVREVERPAPPPQVIVKEVERPPRRQQRSIVYDEPIPVQRRNLVAIEPAPSKYREGRPTQKMISHVYDEGRLVTQPRPKPPMIIEKDFVRNPNFVEVPKRRMTRPGSPVYIQEREVQRTGDWALMPIRKKSSSRKLAPTYVVENPPAWGRSRPTAKIIHTRSRSEERRPRERILRPQVAAPAQRPRAYSDERPRLYTVQRPEPFAREVPGVFMGRPRAHSEERPVRYQHSAAKPRVYTDKEITQFYEEFPPRTGDRKTEYYQEHPPRGVKTEYYKEDRDGRGEDLREIADGQVNGRKPEDKFEPVANWDSRPSTPY